MNIENTASQMRKGVLEFCILSVIQRGEAYPSDIIVEMKKAHLSFVDKIEKCRPAHLPLGGKLRRSSPEIFLPYGERCRLLPRVGKYLEGNGRRSRTSD